MFYKNAKRLAIFFFIFQDSFNLICGLYYKNMTIVNDETSWSIILELSIML
jgi:hypothetical protein